MTIYDVKDWVVRTASVTYPYRKYWSASVTLGIDIDETGDTIEKAYNKLATRIFSSPALVKKLLSILND